MAITVSSDNTFASTMFGLINEYVSFVESALITNGNVNAAKVG